jgi:hypothetical protein
MNTTESLKQLERRAYRSTFEDGIYDIQFGLIFLILCSISLLASAGISRFAAYGLFLIPIFLPFVCKRLITIPRMGSVEFGEKRKSKRRIAWVIAGAVILLMLPLMIAIAGKGVSGIVGWQLVALLGLPVFVVGIYAMDFPRLWIYAGLLIAGIAESEFLISRIGRPYNDIVAFGLPGLVVMAIGLNMLVRFIQKYPKSRPEANHAT